MLLLLGANRGGPATPINTVAPAVTGNPYPGSVLTTTNGTWTASPSSYAYQWKRDGTSIGGATASTYTLVDADNGHGVRCIVTAVNANGSTPAGSNVVAVLAWTPLALGSALKGWWDARNVKNEAGTVALNGETVKTLTDLSGNSKHMLYDTALSVFPKLRTAKTDANFGPSDALEFDGSQLVTAVAIAPGQPFTAWVVARNDVGDKVMLGGEIPSFGLYTASGSGQAAWQAGNFLGSTAVTLGLWAIHIGRFNHAVDGNSKLRVDGADADVDDPGAQSPAQVAVGDYANQDHGMTGFLAEAAIVAGAMSDADIARLEHYLSHKWTVDAL